ncbi:TetR family transcriptional regulator [Myxococcus sp. RHST-1-4]|nr:TetR family transcriptional regulator [Myxococcus sp. RHSTA-1-4]
MSMRDSAAVLALRGYGNARAEEMARAAGLSVGSFYRRYGSKGAFAHRVRQWADSELCRIARIVFEVEPSSREGRGFREDFEDFWRQLAWFATRRPECFHFAFMPWHIFFEGGEDGGLRDHGHQHVGACRGARRGREDWRSRVGHRSRITRGACLRQSGAGPCPPRVGRGLNSRGAPTRLSAPQSRGCVIWQSRRLASAGQVPDFSMEGFESRASWLSGDRERDGTPILVRATRLHPSRATPSVPSSMERHGPGTAGRRMVSCASYRGMNQPSSAKSCRHCASRTPSSVQSCW